MLIFKKVADLQSHIAKQKKAGLSIGFVPTMGALHHGHLSLVQRSKHQTNSTVCSIFVNPTQFNDIKDLEKYPRTTEADIALLSSVDCDILFLPPVEEIYPPGLDTSLDLDFSVMAAVMEGEFRPGHFDGMAQVVNRLLEIVLPDQLFMGQKDFQQMSIVRSMLNQLKKPIKLVSCPIIREENGLAMSSRNRRLSAETKANAGVIFETLGLVKEKVDKMSVEELIAFGLKRLRQDPFEAEYVAICDGFTLQEVKNIEDHDFVVVFTAVWVEKVRLIDNLVLKGKTYLNIN